MPMDDLEPNKQTHVFLINQTAKAIEFGAFDNLACAKAAILEYRNTNKATGPHTFSLVQEA